MNAATKNYEIKISGDKQHVIRIRSNDAYDRSDVETMQLMSTSIWRHRYSDMDISNTLSSMQNLRLMRRI
ncbi:MAG: hypothetical protein ACLTDX_06165 [[Clostridium] innocuum]